MARRKKLIQMIYKGMAVIILVCLGVLFGCAQTGSKAVLKNIELSADEYKDWYGQFKTRINKTQDEDLGPFIVYITGIIGDDKARMPREGERLLDSINAKFKGKPDGYKYSKMERAELLGAWDRIFIILNEEMGKKGFEILKRLVAIPL